ncbi:ABC transporter permease [Microtetraspora fusca]|uniref:ABC transporter permease n=1 Tax=Microtetraspora fusca TaxID=1997 RepID=A0ABW6VIQ3_MICFU
MSVIAGPMEAEAAMPAEALEADGRERRLRSRRYRIVVITTRVLLVAAVLGFWQAGSGTIINPFWVSSPSRIVARLATWLGDGTLWANTVATLTAMALGFTLGSLAGVVVGFTLGRVRFLADVLTPFVIAVNSLPKLALAPLFILWFGIGLQGKVVMTSLVCFFLVFYNTFAGARDTDDELLGVVSLMGAGRRDRLIKVIIPSSATWIFTGLRLAVPYSLVGAVVSEITASSEGLGHLLKTSANTFDTAGSFAAIVVLVVVALVINIAVSKAEGLISRWK